MTVREIRRSQWHWEVVVDLGDQADHAAALGGITRPDAGADVSEAQATSCGTVLAPALDPGCFVVQLAAHDPEGGMSEQDYERLVAQLAIQNARERLTAHLQGA